MSRQYGNCAIEGCEDTTRIDGHGLCGRHYQRWAKYGDPYYLEVPVRTAEERYWINVHKLDSGCWEWQGTVHPDGYGQFSVDGRMAKVHRWAYEQFVGPIPDGLTIDHLCHSNDLTCLGGVTCRHRRCVNPEHMEPVTRRVNSRRGVKGRKTECINGHAFDENNTIKRPGGQRGCRACGREATRRYQARKAAAA